MTPAGGLRGSAVHRRRPRGGRSTNEVFGALRGAATGFSAAAQPLPPTPTYERFVSARSGAAAATGEAPPRPPRTALNGEEDVAEKGKEGLVDEKEGKAEEEDVRPLFEKLQEARARRAEELAQRSAGLDTLLLLPRQSLDDADVAFLRTMEETERGRREALRGEEDNEVELFRRARSNLVYRTTVTDDAKEHHDSRPVSRFTTDLSGTYGGVASSTYADSAPALGKSTRRGLSSSGQENCRTPRRTAPAVVLRDRLIVKRKRKNLNVDAAISSREQMEIAPPDAPLYPAVRAAEFNPLVAYADGSSPSSSSSSRSPAAPDPQRDQPA